jgi:hypothetical protein
MGVRAKTEKMSVTLPKELAGEIRSIVSHGGISSFFTEALEHYISYRKQVIAMEKGFGAWKDKNHPELTASKDTLGYVNAVREAGSERFTVSGDISGK